MIKLKNKGFTVLELLASILVISIGILAAYSVTQRILAQTIDSADRITAVYLAKEGIEIVRNIRDTNWIEDTAVPTDWDDGLTVGDWQADYNTSGAIDDSYDSGEFLTIDGNGFYSYSGTLPTKFKRKITITSILPASGKDGINIEVEVSWEKRGQSHNLIVQENLYDWK